MQKVYFIIFIKKKKFIIYLRGILCVINIPENTFVDAEDGTTSKLKLKIYSIDQQKNFLTALSNSVQIEGVSIQTGSFKFRIEARDTKNQVC